LNPSEKYESQWEGLSHILWKIKNDKKCLKPPTRIGIILNQLHLPCTWRKKVAPAAFSPPASWPGQVRERQMARILPAKMMVLIVIYI